MTATVISPQPAVKRSVRSEVELIPWDPDSPEHVERIRQQRIACGWKQEKVQVWQELQREGKMALQWVVFTQHDPEKEKKVHEHIAAYPAESESIEDTATSLGGKPLNPSRKRFIPVGHISLDSVYENPEHHDDTPGLYWIATFYISKVLQGYGLGRAAMDTVEKSAISEPLNAKILALSTSAKEYDGKTEKWNAMGREPPDVCFLHAYTPSLTRYVADNPQLSLQDWYSRRGFVVYKRVDAMWYDTDPTGKEWPCTAVFMKKRIE